MALLLLWEVDHAQSFPNYSGATSATARLTGFTRRLQKQVKAEPELGD